jgi:hypothetical protein
MYSPLRFSVTANHKSPVTIHGPLAFTNVEGSNNAAIMVLIVLAPQWNDDARPATSNENTETKDTVVGVICLVIFAVLSGVTHSRSPTGFERSTDCYGA